MSSDSVLYLLENSEQQVKGVLDRLFDELNVDRSVPFAIPVLSPLSSKNPKTLIRVFQDIIEKPVFVHRPKDVMPYAAHFVHTEDDVRVAYSRDHNLCWSRFYVVKELAHLLCSTEPEHQTSNPNDLSSLLEELLSGKLIVDSDPQAQADKVAYALAVSLLIPDEWVDDLRHKRAQLIENDKIIEGQEINELAKYLLVPERILEIRLDTN